MNEILSRIWLVGIVCTAVLVAARAPAAQVTLAWTQSDTAGIAGYRVYCGTNSGSFQTVIDVGNKTSATITNLIPGKTYYMAATAISPSGLESAYSGQIAYAVPVPTGARLKLSALPNRQVMLTASCPSSKTYDVLTSSNAKTWTAVGTATSDIYGSLQFIHTPATNSVVGLYRLKLR